MSLRLSSISPMVPPKHSGTLHSPASSCLGAHPPVSSWPLQLQSLHLWHPLAFDISTCYGNQAGGIRSGGAEARRVPLRAALQHQGPAWGPLARRPRNRPKMASLEACHGRAVRTAGELLLPEASRQGAVACQAAAQTPRSRSRRPHVAVESHVHGSALACLGGALEVISAWPRSGPGWPPSPRLAEGCLGESGPEVGVMLGQRGLGGRVPGGSA